jgi:hypothetical protein
MSLNKFKNACKVGLGPKSESRNKKTSPSFDQLKLPQVSLTMAGNTEVRETIFANRRVFFANAVAILASFQYGVDFGLIGGLQAMPGFLQVGSIRARRFINEESFSKLNSAIGFRLQSS